MKKILILFLTAIILVISTSCKQAEPEPINMEPKVSQMKSICELAVMECYYHNVAKLKEEDAEGILWWKKDKHFWIEYSGIVKLGIDASLVTIEVNGTQITITLPEAKVLGCKVDSTSLQEDSYIVDVKSATISAEDEVKAFAVAQQQLEEDAASNRALLAEAQQRAQTLLEEYIINIGNALGKEYSIRWVYLDSQGKPLSNTINMPITENESANTENSSN